MLPFMKKKPQVGVIVTTRPADETKQAENHEDSDLEYCAEDLINAIHSKDKKAVADALRSAFDVLDASPHVEGPHINESQE